MEILIFLVPLAALVVAAAIWAFIWALRRGQFDDLDSPAWRILFDDQHQPSPLNDDKDQAAPVAEQPRDHDHAPH